ncbi:DinB family protein [Burkholderia gladioli]|uniref:DinB family protein n=1 Tax=Burkholderia gladioli TaxID=28095 RepID=UPI001C279B30|nr:DinB family protein [Burkholderia gladioli]MBU9379104.1 DinB family protein [Burkholderia gladioli]
MNFSEYVIGKALYNRWANEKILEAAATLPPAQRDEPLVPGLDSIYAVLNHVLVVDRIWVAEVDGSEFDTPTTRTLLHPDWDGYLADRRRTDARTLELVSGFSDAELTGTLYCDEEIHSELREWPFASEIDHIFRHQAHHRGQVVLLMEATPVGRLKIDGLFVPPDPRLGTAETAAAWSAA